MFRIVYSPQYTPDVRDLVALSSPRGHAHPLSCAPKAPGASDALFQLRDLDNLWGIYLPNTSASRITTKQQQRRLPSQAPAAQPGHPPSLQIHQQYPGPLQLARILNPRTFKVRLRVIEQEDLDLTSVVCINNPGACIDEVLGCETASWGYPTIYSFP